LFLKAETELAEARIWYGLLRDGLDLELMQRIDETLQRISNAPQRFPRVHRQLRRAIVKKFPFGIFYEVTHDEILVFAVFHSRRDPRKLTSRLKHLSDSEWS
jgi:plasmid stabilization system protein ParE